jgi:hypothetical protein
MTMASSSDVTYSGCDITSGTLRILFNPDCLGTLVMNAFQKLPKAVSAAPQPKSVPNINYAARHSIKAGYQAHIDDLARAFKQAHNTELKFDPGFEETAVTLEASKGVMDS